MLIGSDGNGVAAPANTADLIKDSDTEGFMADVIDASMSVAVVVDFWAPWCGPCKQLTPLLEKLTRQYAGKVKLVKINVDENQQLAAQFRVQSIPAVYAFKEGRPFDGFMGALPESQLKQFFERLTGRGGNPIDEALAAADAMVDEGNADEAMAIYLEVLAQDPAHVKAAAGLIRCHLLQGNEDAARIFISQLPEEVKAAPEIASLNTKLELKAATAGDAGKVADLEAKVAADPKDMQARLDLAMARYGAGDNEKAMSDLLDMIALDRAWNEEAAKKQLVKLFEAFGPKDPLTAQGRRRLSSIMFS
jgi:putative thioredoxin